MSNSGNVLNNFNSNAEDRRRSARHNFTAAVDVMDPRTHLQIAARTSDLDHQGCYIDTLNPFLAGTSIVVRVAKDKQSFNTMATVVYAHSGMGMGVIFDALTHDQLSILERWLGKSGVVSEPTAQAAPKQAVAPPSERPPAAPQAGQENTEVLKYLVLMLVQKAVLAEFEGQALLERLLR
jgi:PilZ domain